MTFRIVFTTSIIKPHRQVQISMPVNASERADSTGGIVVLEAQMKSCWQSAALIMRTKRISLCSSENSLTASPSLPLFVKWLI